MSSEDKHRILYIDDEESNLRVFKNLYRRHFTIVTTSSIEECLKLFDKEEFDLVIADQRMPETTGLDLLAKIKNRKPFLPTILLTAYVDHDVLKKAFNDIGVHKYINKPFEPNSLLAVMQLAIESYHLNLEKNKIQADLEASESEFRGIFNSISDVFIRVDNDGVVQVVSPSIKDLSGYTSEELLGNKVDLLYQEPTERNLLIEGLEKAEFIRGSITTIITKEGKRKYVSSNSKHYYDEQGNALGIESVVRDITARILMEKELLDQKNFLDEVQKIANLGSWQWERESNQLIWSETLCDIYKLKPSEAEDSTLESYLSYFHHADKRRVRDIIFSSIEEAKNFSFEARIVRSDGSLREISSHGKVITNTENVLTKIIVACLDITKAKRREQKLSESENKFRLLSEQSPVQILKINKRLRVEYANDSALSGSNVKNGSKRTIQDFFSDEIRSDIIDAMLHVFENNQVHSIEVEYGKGDQSKSLSVDVAPLNDYTRAIDKSVLLMVNDITEKKRTESMLRDLNLGLEKEVKKRTRDLEETRDRLQEAYQEEKKLSELKSQFVSTASHQFRTPLTVIQSNIGLLEMQINNAEPEFRKKFDKVYHRIRTEVERMTDLMDKVLILGKKESGAIKPNLLMVDVLQLSLSIIENYNEIQEDGRKVEVTHKGSPSMYHLDPELFENAFSNLISNAFKYSKGKPAPKVHLRYTTTMLIITVQDFGVGIPEEDIKNIFEPFYRAKNAREIKGTGLGTSIIKAYLELMDVSINVKSKLDVGTTFIIEIKK